jgi:dipeptidyl aminopeptidase
MPNPGVSLHIVTFSEDRAQSFELTFPEPFEENDRLLTQVLWLNGSTLLVRMMNRVQDRQQVYIARDVSDVKSSSPQWEVQLVRKEQTDDGGWFTPLQSAFAFKQGYLELSEKQNNFMHVAYYEKAGDREPKVWLTTGEWEVTRIIGVHEEKGLVYVLSTERHVYVIDLETQKRRRLTQTPVSSDRIPTLKQGDAKQGFSSLNATLKGYYEATLSPGKGYLNLLYHGPGVPFSVVQGTVKDSPVVVNLNQNLNLMDLLRTYQLPTQVFTTIKNDQGDSMNVKLLLPIGFDPQSSKKYPVLMKVYGGPNSQLVDMKYGFDFMTAVANADFVVALIDGRGTGAKGRKYRNWVSKQLGKYETLDQVNGARYLASLPFIDAKRIAIWGWSYGGYMTCKVMEADQQVISLGMAVAPVTNWLYYDSVYTERYMKTPRDNPNGYEASAVRDMTMFRTKDFLLVHGLSDDNVHFQHSADLVYHLTREAVNNYQVQVYTDSDHGMSVGGADRQIYILLRRFLFNRFNVSWQHQFE